jgi:non-specific serine/threonine protein kinase
MGLGKTIQVISLLLLVKFGIRTVRKQPHLLILPASLLGNWQAEVNRFAPVLRMWVAHSSGHLSENKNTNDAPNLLEIDLVITTYATLSRLPWMSKISWDMVILDEAQAIKNPTAKQTRAIKTLTNRVRFILTGTPIENNLLELWSIFDFIMPGYLYNLTKFNSVFIKDESHIENLKRMIRPFILRRTKKQVIKIPL